MSDEETNVQQSPSFRERALHWLTYAPALTKIKRLIPDGVKRGVRSAVTGGSRSLVELDLGEGARISYRLNDGYWAACQRDIRGYEPELWFAADRFIDKNTIFVDCGANIGLWSSYAAAKIKNPDMVIAVEPGQEILPDLRRNHALNRESFTLLEEAIWSEPGKTMNFNVHASHAASSLVFKEDMAGAARRTIAVRTASVDSIVDDALRKAPHAENVIVKLDVEGVEKQALDGAARTLAEKNAMVIYEDHAKDPKSETTDCFLKKGLNVYYIAAPDDVRAIRSAEELESIKTIPSRGYNFFACRPGSRFDQEFTKLCDVEKSAETGHQRGLVHENAGQNRRALDKDRRL